ncbi:MAG: hypothetical protein K1X57_18910, partial [Gemmataceae bacterium]|nr:hypothetical protein [Gemmataceae bacterium]
MAAQVLFKSACPSCEALLPIRDEGMIGKKVECPKCKYKFVVEEPSGFSPADSGNGDTPKKAKKKAKSNTPMLIGAGVGTIAIVALAGVAYLVFGGGDPPKPAPRPAPVVASNNTPAADNPAGTQQPTDTPPKTDAPPAGATNTETPVVNVKQADPVPPAGTVGDITNLLPNDSQMIVEINLDKLRFSTFGEQMFESKVGFRPDAFKEKIGIGHDDMLKLVHAENTEQKWAFNVLRTLKPVDMKDLQKVLIMKKGPKSPINGREYWELGPNQILDNISAALKPEAEIRSRRDKSAGAMSLCQLDQSTLVFASMEPMEEFLKQNAKPKQLTKPSKPAGEGDNATPAPSGGEQPKRGRSMIAPVVAHRFSLNSHAMEMLQDAEAPIAENATFLTVDSSLKAMMDRIHDDPKVKPIMRGAANMQADPRLFGRIRTLTGGLLNSPQGTRIFGMAITHYELEKFYGTAGIEFFNENDVKELENSLKKSLPPMVRL